MRDIIANALANPVDLGWTCEELAYIARTGQRPERLVACAPEYRGE